MSLTVALLAYREAENLVVLLPLIHQAVAPLTDDYEILVVDTKEPLDNTAEVCRANNARYVNQEEPQFGGAFRTAIRHAQKEEFLILDSDGSHNPEHIPAMWEKFRQTGADVVIGSRYVQGGKTHDKKSSVLMSRTLNAIFRLSLGIRAHDVSTDFRLYHTAQLKSLELFCNNYDVLQEVLLKLRIQKRDLRIEEVPIEFRKRAFGDSKRALLPFIASYIKTLLRLMTLRVLGKSGRVRDREAAADFITYLGLYILIGVLAAALDFAIFTMINHLSGYTAVELANIAGGVCGFFCTFGLNTFLNFQKTDRLFQRFLSYLAVCLMGIVATTVAIDLLRHLINLNLLKVCCMFAFAVAQFFLNKNITYREFQKR